MMTISEFTIFSDEKRKRIDECVWVQFIQLAKFLFVSSHEIAIKRICFKCSHKNNVLFKNVDCLLHLKFFVKLQMIDFFNIVANVINVVVSILHDTSFFLNDLQKLKNASKTVKRLKKNEHSVEITFTIFQFVKDRKWQSFDTIIIKKSKTMINICTKACDQFRVNFQHWTKHSKNEKLTMKNRANVKFLKQKQIKTMSKQFWNCKFIINFIVNITIL